MATVRAIAVDGEVILNTELVITSALAFDVTITLPPVGDGTGATVADNTGITVWANSTGGVNVKDQYGHRVAYVAAGDSCLFMAVSFGLGNLANRWTADLNPEIFPLKAVTEELVVGAGAAIAFGATTPGAIATPATVNRFIKFIASDGLPVYVPCWR